MHAQKKVCTLAIVLKTDTYKRLSSLSVKHHRNIGKKNQPINMCIYKADIHG